MSFAIVIVENGRGMKVKAVSGIMLTLLLIGMLTLAFNIQLVKASGTIYIRADGSVDPDTAPISSVDNVTYTFIGNINDSIVVERDNIVVDGAGYTVQGTGSGTGIDLSSRNNVTLKNAEVTNFKTGIYLSGSSNNTLTGNTASNNTYGINLYYSSNNNVLTGNNASNNNIGIHPYGSSNNILAGNIASSNNLYGILLSGSSNNNVLTGNTVSSNNNNGIRLYVSSNNVLFHNTLINNTLQANVITGYANTWDDGYPSGGNYWSDYTGADVKSGPNQDQPSSDGIGDTAYVIDGNNRDNYPLMCPWSTPSPPSYNLTIYSSPTGITFTVDVVSRTTPWSGTYTEDASVSLVMPETHDGYIWSHWLEDGDTNRIKTVTMDTNITLTAVFTPDTTPPSISIVSPENKTYPVDVPLTFTVSESTSWMGYSLDGQTNVTISGNTTIVGLSDGIHTITVYANDTAGNMGASDIVHFTVDTIPPIAEAGMNQTVDEDIVVTLDGSNSTDNGEIVSHIWTFMDVTPQTLSGAIVTYNFTTPRVYTVTLNVTDAAGNWDTDTVVITVLDVTDPIADAGPDQTVNEDTSVNFDGSGSWDNVGIASYTWGFTDVTPQTLTGIKPKYTFNNVGDFEVTLNVTDYAGKWDTDTMWVYVLPDTTPPSISIVSPENKTYPVEDVTLTFTVSESTSWMGYSLDNQANVTITGNTTLSGLSEGIHNIIIYANDTSNNMGSSSKVYFTIDTTASCVPSLISPEEGAVLDNGRTDTLDDIVWDFDWSDCEGASQYHLYVIGPTATIPVINVQVSESSYHDVSSGSYISDVNRFNWTWKVRAQIDDQWGEWSETRTFDVEPVNSDPPATPKELAYDDGVSEGYVFSLSGSPQAAVRFSLPIGWTTAKILAAKYHIDGNPASFKVYIYDSDGMVALTTPFAVTPTTTGWFEVDLTGLNIIVNNDFYIAIEWASAGGPHLGMDTSSPDLRTYERGSSMASWMLYETHDDMIRAVVKPAAAPPVASFTIEWIDSATPKFDASGSYDPDGTIVSYRWDFGDGSTGEGKVVSHTYSSSGTYTVTLTVEDDGGLTDQASLFVGPTVDTVLPVAEAGLDQTVNEDTLLTFDGSGSWDNVGIVDYTWAFTDVTPQTLTGVNPTYNFTTPGVYVITLNVTDAAGNWDTDTVVITVLDVTDPIADAGPDQTVVEDAVVSFDAGDSSDNMGIISYEWDFGDENKGTGMTTTHTYTEPGNYTVTLTVKDAAGNDDTDSIVITVLLDTDGDGTPDTTDQELSVGNYIEYEYNFTGTYVGEMEGTIRAEVTEVDGANYTVRVDYSPTDPWDSPWTETYSDLILGEDFMAPLTMMWQAEHVADETVQTKVGTVSAERYTTMGAIPEHDDAIYVHKESKILVLRTLNGQTVMEITDTDILVFRLRADTDDDNDGVLDVNDAFPLDPTESADADEDGIGDNADTDDDNDGIPDTWETENGLNPLDAADASLDPDGDGLTNIQEYQGGTDPNVSDAEALPTEAIPLWVLGVAAAVVIGIAAAVTILWRRRK